MPLDASASPAEPPPPWRDHVHPAADLFPLMADDELRELGRDILANGLRQPLVFIGDQLLDGRNRLAAVELSAPPRDRARLVRLIMTGPGGIDPVRGLVYPRRDRLPRDTDATAYVISANVLRRHLTGGQRRELIEKLLIDRPERSDRATARLVGSSPTTVGTVRHDLEERGDVSKLDTRTDSIGREQPATKPEPAHPVANVPPEPEPSEPPPWLVAGVAEKKEPREPSQETVRAWVDQFISWPRHIQMQASAIIFNHPISKS